MKRDLVTISIAGMKPLPDLLQIIASQNHRQKTGFVKSKIKSESLWKQKINILFHYFLL